MSRPPPRNAAAFRKTLTERKAICFCLEPYSKNHEPVSMECCKQVVGESCLNTWIDSGNENHNRCPHCRAVLFERPDDVPEDEDEDEDEDDVNGNFIEGFLENLVLFEGAIGTSDLQVGNMIERSNSQLQAFWRTIHDRPAFYVVLWIDIRANLERIRNSPDVASQWVKILTIVRHLVRSTHSAMETDYLVRFDVRAHWGLAVRHLDALEGVSGPGPLTYSQGDAYRAVGPLFDCAYLMFKCAEILPRTALGYIEADLFSAVVGEQGGLWNQTYERSSLRDWFLWGRMFGDALRFCDSAHVKALRLLSALLLSEPLPRIQQVLLGPGGIVGHERIEHSRRVRLVNSLQQDLGPTTYGRHYERLRVMSNTDLLSRWEASRLAMTPTGG